MTRKSTQSEYVVCMICKQEFKQIHWSHLRVHGLTVAAYLQQFPGSPIVSLGTHTLRAEIGRKNLTLLHKDPDFAAAHKERWLSYLNSPQAALNSHVLHSSERLRSKKQEVMRANTLKAWRNKPEIMKANLRSNSYGCRVSDEDYEYRSKLEFRFATWLRSRYHHFEYEPRQFEYTRDGTIHTYTPDFYVYSWGGYIEVKMSWDQVDFDKLAGVDAAGCSIRVVTKKCIKRLERLF